MNDIFLQASRLKLRFPSIHGPLTVEDLWEIPLNTHRANKASLENIGADLLVKQRDLTSLKDASIFEDSSPSPELQKVNLQVAILREIAKIRQDENKAKTLAAAKATERARLEALIKEREGAELPLEDLKKQLAELG